ncbi:type 1 glutamine amidotransferase domain-containing protein [Jeotgalibacillus aurantiacus]|uniref:type 1 glutamine amidotransferase domain-containing protein n=1 Tax=Jeotgalibacillus aurantiacus TaxID=2763266 RepID=UPI001D0BD7BC|nr:type 1 glutamine amidotransferase domain-containing protein [Jeotgalibacillus aurantiacus]
MKTILLVVSNPAVSTTTGWPVGFWLSELTHPYHTLKESGYEVTIASPEGGKVEWDALSNPRDESGYSKHDELSLKYLDDPAFLAMLEQTPAINDLDLSGFDGIIVAGGQAPMFTFKEAKNLQDAFLSFYTAGKPSAALCHGTALLLYLNEDGRPFVQDKKMTGFTNEEEALADQAAGLKVMPFKIEEEAVMLGADFHKKEPWTSFAVRDGNLITGQQQESGKEVAELLVSFFREEGVAS